MPCGMCSRSSHGRPISRIHRRQYYLWRAVDQDGDVIGILVQPRHNTFGFLISSSRLPKKSVGPSPTSGGSAGADCL
jgi:hypothetical protein